MATQFAETFTFDDVLLQPNYSEILPADAILATQLTAKIQLQLPFLSAPMDTVTEHKMAVRMALAGGMGIIHKNLAIHEQAREVQLVKRFENGFVEDPVTLLPEAKVADAARVRSELGYKNVPVVDKNGKLAGMLTDVDYIMPDDAELMIKFRMKPRADLIVAHEGVSLKEANKMIREHRLRVLPVVDKADRLVSIVTRSDIEKNELYPNAAKDSSKHLRVGAAIGVGPAGIERAEALIAAGADAIIIDTAHGHTRGVLETLKTLKKKFKAQDIIVGNIATAEAARDLIAAGADAIKVGIGPGSICTTRVVSGVGVPQLSAVLNVVEAVKKSKKKVPVIADGGIRASGDIVKALAAGASCVMMGNMFAGTDESPGRVEYVGGRMFKLYRGMGSLEAMERGSRDRYGQAGVNEKKKLVPEGVSGKIAYKGAVDPILYQLAGGLRSGMGYCGAQTLPELAKKAKFVKISATSQRESHPHSLAAIDAAPNYAG